MDKHETWWWGKLKNINPKPIYVDTDEAVYDVSSLYPHIMKKEVNKSVEKCYEITLANDEVKTMENVETLTFSDGNLSAYNAEGDMVAHFRRDTYKYFELVGE